MPKSAAGSTTAGQPKSAAGSRVKVQLKGQPEWMTDPLYLKLVDILPAFAKPHNQLDVYGLAKALNRSYETVYKWFRYAEAKAAFEKSKGKTAKPVGQIKPRDIENIVVLAGKAPNRKALLAAGKPIPAVTDLSHFLFG